MQNTALSSTLAHELAFGHVLMMQCGATALRILDKVGPVGAAQLDVRAGDEAIRMADLSARLMGCHTTGVQLLHRLPPVACADPPPLARQPASGDTAGALSAIRKLHAEPSLRRGQLRNGNPSGDYLKSPRCGARTRAGGCCRQPAMANGRCRMHGGLSTGPRTPEGRTRCRTTRLVHGYRTRAHLALRSRAAHAARRLRDLTAELRASSAGHRVHRSISIGAPCGSAPTAGRANPKSAPTTASTQVISAGHGVHGSNSFDRNDTAMQSRPENPSSASPRLCVPFSPADRIVPAGHGVHRSIRDHLRSSASICGSNPSFPPAPAAPMRNFVLQSAAALR
jgi:hypothetical protein